MVAKTNLQFYINGEWISPVDAPTSDLHNPATEEYIGTISLGNSSHVDMAVAAARKAFARYSLTDKDDRLALLERIAGLVREKHEELAEIISTEIGSPIGFSRSVQVENSVRHIEAAMRALKDYQFRYSMGGFVIRKEPIGVCGLITPWNWPLNLIMSKLAAALAAGCTVVVKPSEIAPFSALKLCEIMHEAETPAGVFNLINGTGPEVGEAIARHPDIDMVSFTGSTRAGILVAKAGAETVKRISQELGGKSANIILPGTDLEKTIPPSVVRGFINAGQSCQAPTRLLVHESELSSALSIAKRTAESLKVGDPFDEKTDLGPIISKVQFDRVQDYINIGVKEGATLLTGGPGKPTTHEKGYFVKPTIFSDVTMDMRIAREEIFGPVLVILAYRDTDHAVEIANGTVYGLSAYISSSNLEEAQALADRLRAGRVYINNAPIDQNAPFGGYKQSGNGREQGVFGLESYLETKAVLGLAS